MATREDIEHYLIQMGHPHETIADNMWVVRNEANIVISYEPPLVIFRSKLMELPKKNRQAFFRRLLELNASEMIHGAYGIEGNHVLIARFATERLALLEERSRVGLVIQVETHKAQVVQSASNSPFVARVGICCKRFQKQ